MSGWVSEWVTGLGAQFFVYLNPLRILGFIICQELGGRGLHIPLPAPLVSQVLHMLWRWNLHQGWPLIKEVDWWRYQLCHVTRMYFTDQNHFCWHQQKMADHVINQLLWSRRLPRVSFNLIACLEPVKQDDHCFYAEILICKFHLRSIKACLRMRRRFCHQIFCAKMFPRKFCSWDKVSCKTIKGFQSHLKKPSQRVNKTLDARCAHQVIKHFKFLFMHSCMLCAPHLVPGIEYIARINHIILFLTENKSLEINFPEIALNNTLMTTNSCKSTTIL